jgi:hypothetical protein
MNKLKRRYLWGLTLVSLTLVLLHGMEFAWKFKVDSTTLGLLILAALPVLREIVGTVKAGGLELNFRELAVHQQIFKLLDGVASQRTWTFYTPRSDEHELGEGFAILIENLEREHKQDLIQQLKVWLEADSNNLRWFAAEIIGYFRIEGLKNRLRAIYRVLDHDASLEPWELNCVWAYSRFQNYEELNRLLEETKSDDNKFWILNAYWQMAKAKGGLAPVIVNHLRRFKERKDISPQLKIEADRVLAECIDERSQPNNSFNPTPR